MALCATLWGDGEGGGGICMCKVKVVRFSFQPKFSFGNSKKIIVSKFFNTNTLLDWFWDLVYTTSWVSELEKYYCKPYSYDHCTSLKYSVLFLKP